MKNSFIAFAVFVLCLFSTDTMMAQKVRLRSQINPACATGSSAKFADIHAEGNTAVQGSYNCRGVFIYDISDPDAPKLASWYNPAPNQSFLEAIVIGGRGYFGSGGQGPGGSAGDGVHIVDLSNPYNPVLMGKVNSSAGNGFNSIHEMLVWNNILIENANTLSNKTLKFINVSNPANPVHIRDLVPTDPQWVHAMHVRGNRLFTSGWGNGSNRARTEIYDLTGISATRAPTLLGFIQDTTTVTAGNSMHSSWTSEDGRYLYSAREIGDSSAVSPGDIRVYDIADPAVPLLIKKISMAELGLNAVTPHNPVVMGDKLYVSWYQAGLQVFDIRDPRNPVRIGQFDTYERAFAEEERKALATFDPSDIVCGRSMTLDSQITGYDGMWAVYPFLGEDRVITGDLTSGLFILDVTKATAPSKNLVSDFDGDGKTDFSVQTAASGVWQIETSSDNNLHTQQWGLDGDILAAGDYDGDGKSDMAVWRPSNGFWYIIQSSGEFWVTQWGLPGDIPVAADYDADGRTDLAVWRPSNGTWYLYQSKLGIRTRQWGLNGDKPFAGDYEGDGKTDLAVWRPSEGKWYIVQSSTSFIFTASWGLNGDKPVVADFDGDGRVELSVFRPDSSTWYILNYANNTIITQPFGLAGDVPVPADYDGDGKADMSVFRGSTNEWYRLNSTGGFFARAFGDPGSRPSPASVQPQ